MPSTFIMDVRRACQNASSTASEYHVCSITVSYRCAVLTCGRLLPFRHDAEQAQRLCLVG